MEKNLRELTKQLTAAQKRDTTQRSSKLYYCLKIFMQNPLSPFFVLFLLHSLCVCAGHIYDIHGKANFIALISILFSPLSRSRSCSLAFLDHTTGFWEQASILYDSQTHDILFRINKITANKSGRGALSMRFMSTIYLAAHSLSSSRAAGAVINSLHSSASATTLVQPHLSLSDYSFAGTG